MFLYKLSRVAYGACEGEAACSLYLSNKMLNAVDMCYEVELPEIFAVEHPVDTVLGRAKYNDRLHVSQNTTVGNNHDRYPGIGENVTIHFEASIIGDTVIGNNVEVAANAYIKDTDIPSNCIVFGQSPHLVIKEKTECEMRERLTQFVYD